MINYLLDELDHLNLKCVCYSLCHFKHYNNIVIHYKGDNCKLFIEKVSTMLTYLIIFKMEKNLLNQLLSQNYFYFSLSERAKILDLSCELITEDNSNNFENKFKMIYDEIYNHLVSNKSLFLTGFIYFRLKDYIELLNDCVSEAVNNFIIEKEYSDFISLLKLYINSQYPNCDIVYIVYSDSNCLLFDEQKNIIDIRNLGLNNKYLSDISFSDNDYMLNALLTLLPKKIVVYTDKENKTEFLTTLKKIFENRISFSNKAWEN